MKRLLADIFAPPKGHPRTKPFHDHVISFSLLEGRVLIRHYQHVPPDPANRNNEEALVEIGPRCVPLASLTSPRQHSCSAAVLFSPRVCRSGARSLPTRVRRGWRGLHDGGEALMRRPCFVHALAGSL